MPGRRRAPGYRQADDSRRRPRQRLAQSDGASRYDPAQSRPGEPARRAGEPAGWSGSTPTCSAPTGTGATCWCSSGGPGCAGIEVEAVEVNSDQPVPRQGDIYLIGGGEDLPQILAARRLRADGGLQRGRRGGAVVFAVCAGYQLLGTEFGGVGGRAGAGLDILDISSGAASAAASARSSPTSTRRSACPG